MIQKIKYLAVPVWVLERKKHTINNEAIFKYLGKICHPHNHPNTTVTTTAHKIEVEDHP